MKKTDLHIHTIKSILDSSFEFELLKLKEYVDVMKLDVIAITNHNLFDLKQFKLIRDSLDIVVLPGIEISLSNGHLLLISDNTELEDFAVKCKEISDCVMSKEDTVTIEKFEEVFSDLTRYILIPHYKKKPMLDENILVKLKNHITAGEVNSVKKFIYSVKDDNSLVPVLFSDIRISANLKIENLSSRQTYIDLNEFSFNGLKLCLSDKSKVSLSIHDGHKFFQVHENGLVLSTGLNVMLGERSSGKSFTLDMINDTFESVKYIEQFSLLEKDEKKEAERFKQLLASKQSFVTQNYLKEFKEVVEEVVDIDLNTDLKKIDKYLQTLKKFAMEQEKTDCFSNTKLFNESKFVESSVENLKDLIESAMLLYDNTEYRNIIDKYVNRNAIAGLIIELISKYNLEVQENLKKRWLNELIENVKKELDVRTATTQIKDIDLLKIAINSKKIEKFIYVCNLVKIEKEIDRKNVQGFNVVASTELFSGAQQMKTLSQSKIAFSTAFNNYDDPYKFLQRLKSIGELEDTELYKYFVQIKYKILNRDNFEVSGGERSEYNLLQQINDAKDYDMLLIDEPESSFDNIFLKNDVNDLIKSIAFQIPVVVITHNNTIGASINPDYVLYTKKEVEDNDIKYKIFFGHPSDKELKSVDGEKIANIDVIYNCLEAGKPAYVERGKRYEILENK